MTATRLSVEPYEIPAADVGPENPLPRFRDANEDRNIRIDESVPEEDRKYLGWRTGFRVLPHRMQDGYTRERRPHSFRSVVLENEFVRATFLPELGGRLVSLVDKTEGRELLHRNPVFQPANLALRNAWFSGGIEWNTSHLGHYYLTCSPVFAARVASPDGYPVLRLYEFDRLKAFPFQIDFHLPPGSRFLFSRVRIVNPHEYEIPMYWWTNMAVDETPDTRVLVSADSALHGGGTGVALMPLPNRDGKDMTYSANLRRAYEFFFRIPDGERRFVAALNGQGRGFVQTSTDRLKGRKMFVWGTGPGGKRWQEFLSEPGQAYLEIQAGLARTQLESLPMPARAEWTWTEAFGPLHADPAAVHSSDWSVARRAAEDALENALPRADVEARDAAFAAVTTQAPDEILAHGSDWGALERWRLDKMDEPDNIPPEFVFPDSGPLSLATDLHPWVGLLYFSRWPAEPGPQEAPGQFMIQPEWRQILEQCIAIGSADDWLSHLHLGVMKMESHDVAGARESWETSLRHQQSAWALRNLAALESREKNTMAAADLLRQAWEVGPQIAPLAIEYAQALIQAEQYAEARDLIRSLPPVIGGQERLQILLATAALHTGDYADMTALFERQEFATIREGEITLTDLWFGMHEKRIAAEEGIPQDDALKDRVRRDFPPPANIDFRMHAAQE